MQIQKSRRRSASRGFTLLELMLVVTLIGILSTFALPYFVLASARARVAETQNVFSKLNLYFINLYENNGTFATPLVGVNGASAIQPNPALANLGQPLAWDATLAGWQQMPLTFDSGLKMRYMYNISSDGNTMFIIAVGSIPGLGPNSLTAPTPFSSISGNFTSIETLSGPSVSTITLPSM